MHKCIQLSERTYYSQKCHTTIHRKIKNLLQENLKDGSHNLDGFLFCVSAGILPKGCLWQNPEPSDPLSGALSNYDTQKNSYAIFSFFKLLK